MKYSHGTLPHPRLMQSIELFATEVAPHGVTVNTVQPGMHATDRLVSVHGDGVADLGRTSLAAIDPTFFPNTPPSNVWSGSPSAGNSSYAWLVDFDHGNAGYGSRSYGGRVRLVRAGQ